MRTNLSSQISLNRVSTRYYKPENTIDRSVLTRFEKIPTNIHETAVRFTPNWCAAIRKKASASVMR